MVKLLCTFVRIHGIVQLKSVNSFSEKYISMKLIKIYMMKNIHICICLYILYIYTYIIYVHVYFMCLYLIFNKEKCQVCSVLLYIPVDIIAANN